MINENYAAVRADVRPFEFLLPPVLYSSSMGAVVPLYLQKAKNASPLSSAVIIVLSSACACVFWVVMLLPSL